MKRAARIVAILGAAAFAACFSKPGAPHVRDDAMTGDGHLIDGGGMNDAPDAKPDAPAGTCGIATDNYQSTTPVEPCGNWATAESVAGVTKSRTGTVLSVQLQANTSVSCTSASSFLVSNGTSVEIVSSGFSLFNLTLKFTSGQNNGTASLSMMNSGGSLYMLHLACPSTAGTAIQSITPPVFLRLAATPNGGAVNIQAYYSVTNNNWQMFDSCSFNVSDATRAIGSFGGSGSAGATSSSFDEYNTYACPPP